MFSVEEWTLSNHNKKDQTSSVTTTTEESGVATETSLEALTPREEKVLRMLNGMSEEDARHLQFAIGASDETSMKLALIENQLINCLTTDSPEDEFGEDRPSPAELLSAWIDEE